MVRTTVKQITKKARNRHGLHRVVQTAYTLNNGVMINKLR